MTSQHPGGVPENFDAFSRPAPDPAGDTWVDPAYYAPIDPCGIEGAEGGQPPAAPRPAGLRARAAGLGRGKLIAGGVAALLVVGGAVWGTTAALASSGSGKSAPAAAARHDATAPAGKGARKAGGLKAVRLKITSVAADSFVGTDAKGQSVTVAFGESTHFGTKARPLSPDQLAVGMVVTVAGDRKGASVDATAIVPAKQDAASGGATDTPTDPPRTPAAPPGPTAAPRRDTSLRGSSSTRQARPAVGSVSAVTPVGGGRGSGAMMEIGLHIADFTFPDGPAGPGRRPHPGRRGRGGGRVRPRQRHGPRLADQRRGPGGPRDARGLHDAGLPGRPDRARAAARLGHRGHLPGARDCWPSW